MKYLTFLFHLNFHELKCHTHKQLFHQICYIKRCRRDDSIVDTSSHKFQRFPSLFSLDIFMVALAVPSPYLRRGSIILRRFQTHFSEFIFITINQNVVRLSGSCYLLVGDKT